MPSLNDSHRLVRVIAFAMSAAIGVLVGAIVAVARDAEPMVVRTLLIGGVGIEIAVCVAMVIVTRRADSHIRSQVERATHELVEGIAQPSAPVPARVVRSRRGGNRVGGVIERNLRPYGSLEHGARIVVFAALLGDQDTRRVAALIPSHIAAAMTPRSVHLLHLHPLSSESGVLNARPDADALAAARNDPRWTTTPLPGESQIAGGWWSALAIGLTGLVAGLIVALLLIGLT